MYVHAYVYCLLVIVFGSLSIGVGFLVAPVPLPLSQASHACRLHYKLEGHSVECILPPRPISHL